MSESMTCGNCGQALEDGSTICRSCGWDATTSVISRRPIVVRELFVSFMSRAAVYGLLIALPIAGFARLRSTGPGPDLETTLRWMVLGDDGRSAELVSIHRAFEVGSAASRYAVRHMEAPTFDDGWDERLRPYATMNVRGLMPMLFYFVGSDGAPAAVRQMYDVRARDGWGQPYGVSARVLARGGGWDSDPEVMLDLEQGLHASFFTLGRPDFDAADWMRLELASAGRDGEPGNADDLSLVSYFQVGVPIHLGRGNRGLERQLEVNYTLGPQLYRVKGARFDLVDARLLAEFRFESVR